MKSTSAILAIAFVCSSVLTGRSAPADVLPSARRDATVELASKLSNAASDENLKAPDNLRNPFYAVAEVKAEARLIRPTSDAELLESLADQLHPTGTLVLGGTPILLLGQKKVKLNERVTLSFDGVPYEVEVVGMDRNTFSLRLNKAEVTRPIIKPGKN